MTIRIVFAFLVISCSAIAQDTVRLRIQFVGDIMGHDSQIAAAYNSKTGKYDYSACFSKVKPLFDKADITIGNLELTHGGKPFTGYPQFSSPDELSVAIKEAGIDFLVTANNHSADRHRKGIVRTIKVLDSLQIPHTGTFTDSASRAGSYPFMLTEKGIKLAILNYTYGTNGITVRKPSIVNLIDTAVIHQDLIKAKNEAADFIIVSMHWGLEYQRLPSAEQKRIAMFCFKHGANAVIGGHPHVLQPAELDVSKNQLIAYSLGNFISGQRKRYTDGGMILDFEIRKVTNQPGAKLTKAGYTLTWVNKKGYLILPSDTPLNELPDELSKAAFNLYLQDARELLQRNLNITEIKD